MTGPPVSSSPPAANRVGRDSKSFRDLAEMRAEHAALLKRYQVDVRSISWRRGYFPAGEEADASSAAPATAGAATVAFWWDVDAFLDRGRALGAALSDNNARWEAQGMLDYWTALLHRASRPAPEVTLAEFKPLKVECPYPGLRPFDEAEAPYFFGRDEVIQDVLDSLRDNRLVMIVGSSGSGKSSLVLAGLLPALQSGRLASDGVLPSSDQWHYCTTIVPGSNPLGALALAAAPPGEDAVAWCERHAATLRRTPDHLLSLLRARSASPTVLVVDQFEELFTLTDDVEARRAFADNLVHLAEAGTRHSVVLTIRSDYESKLVGLPDVRMLAGRQGARVPMPPLSTRDLRQAVVGPAGRVGLTFDEAVVNDLVGHVVGEPAALPLLQFVLRQLWEGRTGNHIAWENYKKLGSPGDALTDTADRVYRGLKLEENQAAAKEIFLRLVRPGEGSEFLSSRVPRRELHRVAASDRVDRVLADLVQAGLVRRTPATIPGSQPAIRSPAATGGEALANAPALLDDQFEVSHESLIRNWRTLAGWLEEERRRQILRSRLTSYATTWHKAGSNALELLVKGSFLSEAGGYQDLTEVEAEFVNASLRAERREKRQLWATIFLLAFLLLLTLGLTIYSVREAKRAGKTSEAAKELLRKAILEKADAENVSNAAITARSKAVAEKEEATKAKTDAVHEMTNAVILRDEAVKAREEAVKSRDEAVKARDEAVKAKDEADKARDKAATQVAAVAEIPDVLSRLGQAVPKEEDILALVSAGDSGLPALKNAMLARELDRAGWNRRLAVARAIGLIGGENARVILEQHLHSPDGDVQQLARLGMGVLERTRPLMTRPTGK